VKVLGIGASVPASAASMPT